MPFCAVAGGMPEGVRSEIWVGSGSRCAARLGPPLVNPGMDGANPAVIDLVDPTRALRGLRDQTSLFRMRRCWETAGRVTAMVLANSPTGLAPRARRSKISRWVGSPSDAIARETCVLAIAYCKRWLTHKKLPHFRCCRRHAPRALLLDSAGPRESLEDSMLDRAPSGIGTPEIVLVSPSICAVEWGEVAFAAIPQFQREARARVDAALAEQGVVKVGPEVTFSLSPKGSRIRIAAGSTIAGCFRATDSVTVQEIPGGRAAHLRLEGSYALLPAAWRTLVAWVVEHGHEPAGLSWEAYGDQSVPVTKLYTLLEAR